MKRFISFFIFLSVLCIGSGVIFLFPVQAQIQEEDDKDDIYFIGVVKEISSTERETDPLFADQDHFPFPLLPDTQARPAGQTRSWPCRHRE